MRILPILNNRTNTFNQNKNINKTTQKQFTTPFENTFSNYPIYMHPSFMGYIKRGVYAITLSGKIVKFQRPSNCHIYLGEEYTKDNITEAINNKKLCGDFAFLSVNDVEKTDKKGKTKINQKAVNKARETYVQNAFLTFDMNGEAKIYQKAQDLQKALEISGNQLRSLIKKDNNYTKNTMVFPLVDVILKDKKGNAIFDKKGSFVLDIDILMQKYYNNFGMPKNDFIFDNIKISYIEPKIVSQEVVGKKERKSRWNGVREVYVISYDGKYKKFRELIDVANEYGIKPKNLSACLNGKSFLAENYVVIHASNIEIEDKDGQKIPDSEKIKKALQNFAFANSQPVYSLNYSGVQRHENATSASMDCEVYYANLQNAIKNKDGFLSDYLFVKAFHIEARDENGKLIAYANNEPKIDNSILSQYMDKYLSKTNAVVMINQDGTYQIFNSPKDVEDKIGIRKQNIAKCTGGFVNTVQGHKFVRLREVVSRNSSGLPILNPQGGITISKDKIEEYRKISFKNNF